MRRLFLSFLFPLFLVGQTPRTKIIPLAEAESQYLDAWDAREGKGLIPLPSVSGRDRAALKWLTAAANLALPGNPFPQGGTFWKEAEAVRRFLKATPEKWAEGLKTLPLTLSGSYMALWRWGQPRVRDGRMDRSLRQQWEDRLLAGSGPWLVRDFAIRHALCFALAEADVERFTRTKDDLEEEFPDIFPKFQKAFSLLGSPAPVVHVWTLPRMESVDLPMSGLGGSRVRVEPDPGKDLPEMPQGTVWIVPTREGSQPESSSYLVGASLVEAQQLVPRLEAAGRTAYLAPVRAPFETYALMYFPIQIDLDEQGTILSIRMGDAALVKKP